MNQESYTHEKEAYSNLCVTVHLEILATTWQLSIHSVIWCLNCVCMVWIYPKIIYI